MIAVMLAANTSGMPRSRPSFWLQYHESARTGG